MTLDPKGGLAWLRETGILGPCQSHCHTSLLPAKKPGASDSHESESSRVTGALGPDALFILTSAKTSVHLCFYIGQTRGKVQWITYLTRLLQRFESSPTLFGETVNSDLLPWKIDY